MAVSRKAYYTDQDGTTTEYVYGVDSDHVSIAGDTLTDKIDAVDSSLSDLYNGKADKRNSDGGFEGGGNASSTSGGAVGFGSNSTRGGAVGWNASTTDGGAIGVGARTTTGGAVGSSSDASTGGAVGRGAVTSAGFAGGYDAKAMDVDENPIDAVQLGTGTNSTAKTLQVYDYQLMDASGQIPEARMSSLSSAKHTHTNKTVLDAITSTKTSNWDAAYSRNHTHSNKSVLDGILSSDLLYWDSKADNQTSQGGFKGGVETAATYGGAIGSSATTSWGGAVGESASAGYGGAVGRGSKTSYGFAGGYNAKTIDAEENPIDAIQLGTGTNSTEKTLQVYDYQLIDADGNIPLARMSDNLPNIKKNSASTTGDIIGTHLTVGTRASGTIGSRSFVSGSNNKASGSYSASVGGYNNSVSSSYSVVLGGGNNSTSAINSAVLGGEGSTASGRDATVVGGTDHTASGQYAAVVGGATNVASVWCSAVVGGQNNTNNGESSVILGGSRNTTSGYGCAVIASMENTALEQQIKSGHYATNGTAGTQSGTTGDAFIIGNGTSDTARSNAFRVTYSGNVYGKASFHSSGADYAEYFEWEDGNPNNEDRRGLFVTLDGDKIKIAFPGDDIIGVVSAAPSVVGNTYDDEWQGKYKTDIFGQLITQVVHHDAVYSEIEVFDTDEDGKELDTKHTEQILVHEAYDAEEYVLSDDYDAGQEYIPRSQRKEWAVVGMFGQIVMVDDGTCIVNGHCTVGNNGIATSSNTGYRVLKRIDETHVKVFVKFV